MNGKERMYAALNFQPVDIVPFAPPFQGYWALALAGVNVADSIKEPKMAAKAQVEAVRRCRFDALEAFWDWLSPVEAIGCEVRVPKIGEIATWKHIIAGPSTLENLEHPDPYKDRRFVSGLEAKRLVCRELRNESLCFGSLCSPFTLAGEIRGVQALILDTIIEPGFAKDILEYCTEVISDYCTSMLDDGIENVMLCDPTSSGSLITRADFLKYAHPRMKRIVRQIKKESGISLVHICGNTTDRLEDIASLEMAAFSIDSSVDIPYARKVFGKNVALIGNVNSYKTLLKGVLEDIEGEAMKCLRDGGEDGYILGSSCDILPSTPVKNILILEECRRKDK